MFGSFTNIKTINWRGISVLIGAVLVHISLGTMYCLGNLLPYMASYLRKHVDSGISYSDMSWLGAITGASQGAFMIIGGLINRRFGPKMAILFGSCLVCIGVACTCFTIQASLAGTYVTYGVIFGAGIGICYAPPIECSIRWLPKYKGFISGTVVAGFGAGALVFNQVETGYVNPWNDSPDLKIGNDEFFTNSRVLNRVPYMFLVMAGCYAVLLFIGTLLVRNKHHQISDSSNPEKSENPDPEANNEIVETKTNKSEGILKPKEIDVEPKVVLRSGTFWIFWCTFMVNSQCTLLISVFYKSFGQNFISDDHFLSLTGSIASIGNALGRIFWGYLGDRFSYQVAMALVTLSLSFLFSTFNITSHYGKPMYFVWVVAMFFTFSGSFALFPFGTAKSFGSHHFAVNYSMVFTSQVVSGILFSAIQAALLDRIGYANMFILVGFVVVISFLLTTVIQLTKYGKPVRSDDNVVVSEYNRL